MNKTPIKTELAAVFSSKSYKELAEDTGIAKGTLQVHNHRNSRGHLSLDKQIQILEALGYHITITIKKPKQ